MKLKENLMKFLFPLFVFSNLAFAHTEFKGNLKGTAQPCSLHVEQIYYVENIEKPENLRADVMASLEDDHHHISHGKEFFFTIKPTARPNILSGIADNQKDQLNVITKAGSLALDVVDSYAVKWWHVNHFHSAQCVNLKRVQE
jgi:hypothetical protein